MSMLFFPRDHVSLRHLAMVVLISALLLLQDSLSAHGGLDEQILAITAQIIKDPGNPELLVKRGELYRVAHEYLRAITDLDQASQLRPTMPAAELVRAHLLFDTGQMQGAADASSRFLSSQPAPHAEALVIRARANAKLHRARNAASDLTRALEIRAVPDWYIERARVIATLGINAVDEALRGLDEGIRRLGPLVTLELEAIDLELRRARFDAALARLDRVMGQAARKEGYLARRASILESAGRIAQARSAYHEALTVATRLPPWTQQTAASTTLITQLRANLARLDAWSPARPRCDF